MDNLTDKEIHCMSRIFQSMIFFNGLFHCCKYCRYLPECKKDTDNMIFDQLRKKLGEITGVYLGILIPDEDDELWQEGR